MAVIENDALADEAEHVDRLAERWRWARLTVLAEQMAWESSECWVEDRERVLGVVREAFGG